MERYVERGGKLTTPSILINLICEMMQGLVVLLTAGYRSVTFRDDIVATLMET